LPMMPIMVFGRPRTGGDRDEIAVVDATGDVVKPRAAPEYTPITPSDAWLDELASNHDVKSCGVLVGTPCGDCARPAWVR